MTTTPLASGDDAIDEIRSVWTYGAADYDHDAGHGLITPAVEDVWLGLLAEVLGDEPRDVLDVGAGTGFLSVLVAKLGHRVTATDITPAMLQRAEQRARDDGVSITFVEADAMDLPFASDSFDVVVSRHVLWTMTEPDRAFREWIRVVRPGGEVTWFDGIRHRRTPARRMRELAAGGVRRVRRPVDHAHSHHYDDELASQLPFRGLQSTAPVRELLASMGVRDVSCRAVSRLQRAEQSMQDLHKRMSPASRQYLGRFPVTFELKSRFTGSTAK